MYVGHWLAIGHIQTDFFQTRSVGRHCWILQFDTCVDDFGLNSRSQGYGKIGNSCYRSVVKWHEVAQTFAVVHFIREMSAKKSCKHDKYGSYEHLRFFCLLHFSFASSPCKTCSDHKCLAWSVPNQIVALWYDCKNFRGVSYKLLMPSYKMEEGREGGGRGGRNSCFLNQFYISTLPEYI